jgi:hypothetical protein
MRRLIQIVALAVFIVLLSGCPVPPGGGPPEDEDTDGEFEQVDDLFVDEGSGKYVLETNDTVYWGPYGYTLWAIKGSAQTPFTSRQVVVNKVSGDASAGYGVVFCQYDTGDPDVGETMLVVMINTKQEYIVGEVCGAQFTEIVPWTTSTKLRQGYNQGNTLRVDYASEEYTLSINGVETVVFRDDEPPYHSDGGGRGFIVVISPMDEFPETPVHVIFEEQ